MKNGDFPVRYVTNYQRVAEKSATPMAPGDETGEDSEQLPLGRAVYTRHGQP